MINAKNIISKGLLIFLIITGFNRVAAQSTGTEPQPSGSGAYSWILLPDLQNYQKFERNQPILDIMMNWIKYNRDEWNIGLVLGAGDTVDRNNVRGYDTPDKGDRSGIQQWQNAQRAFSKLNGEVPYVLCVGNHDIGHRSAENRYSHFNSFFPPQGNPLTETLLVEMAPNGAGEKTLENACYEWTSPQGTAFLILSLEFGPRDEILEWAREIAARPAYKDHTGVVLTHCYLLADGKRVIKTNFKMENTNDGEAIWQKLVYPSANIRFVLCGHVFDMDMSDRGQAGYSMDHNSRGKTVHQIMFNAQVSGGGIWGNGGDGWLRILEFQPDGKTLKVCTYSPLMAISPSTQHLAWRRQPYDEYVLTY